MATIICRSDERENIHTGKPLNRSKAPGCLHAPRPCRGGVKSAGSNMGSSEAQRRAVLTR